MFRFVLCKMRNKKWMIISLLLGNLLMVAVAASASMYSQAALQRMFTSDLSDYLTENNKYPGTITVSYHCTTFGKMTQAEYAKVDQGEAVLKDWVEEMKLPVLQTGAYYEKVGVLAQHERVMQGQESSLRLKVAGYADLEDHIHMKSGEIYSSQIQDNTFDVIVNENTFVSQKFLLGEKILLNSLTDKEGKPYYARITGVFECVDVQDPYWLTNPTGWQNVCMMDQEVFREICIDPERLNVNYNAEWYGVLDYTGMRGTDVKEYQRITEKYLDKYEELKITNIDVCYEKIMEDYSEQAVKLNTTIWVLQLPVFVLLISFIFMVSRQMLEMEQNEIAVYKSRGANKGQIVGMYLLQSTIVAVMSLILGIPTGIFLCKVLGASNSFLEFVRRTALPVEISSESILFGIAAAVFSVCTMVLPVLRYADVNIVDHKRKKNRTGNVPVWQKMYIDVILLGISVYGLYLFDSQKEYIARQMMDDASLNPLMYVCSSLFMVGTSLFVLRIFPWIVRFIFRAGKRWWSPAMYSSFLGIIRTRSNQGFLMVFLILTVAMGIYNAQAARTINANAQDKIQYITGADIVLMEDWSGGGRFIIDASTGQIAESGYQEEPSFEKYEDLDGVNSITKVLAEDEAIISVEGGKVGNIMLMGIHTKEFGETAWFKEDLLPAHYHEYLNAISQNSQAILVSSNSQKYGYEIGDVLNYSVQGQNNLRGVIYGFVDYWPSFAPMIRTKGPDGLYTERENFLIVANLSYIQSVWGVTPYQVWIKTEDSSQFIYDFAESTDTEFVVFEDAAAQLIGLKNDPIFQGTNGVLTIGFICILVLCTMGFLIYWILSIQSRTLQFGIFRAMGMSMREVFTVLLNEQFFITGVSIGAGVLVGVLTSRLFVPLIQIAYSSADQVLPMEIVSEGSDYVRLFVVIGAAILLCLVILGWLISKIKIAQALKLGED